MSSVLLEDKGICQSRVLLVMMSVSDAVSDHDDTKFPPLSLQYWQQAVSGWLLSTNYPGHYPIIALSCHQPGPVMPLMPDMVPTHPRARHPGYPGFL